MTNKELLKSIDEVIQITCKGIIKQSFINDNRIKLFTNLILTRILIESLDKTSYSSK